MPVSLKNQVVLVIGASSGVGRATAVMMAREGAKVMACARRKERLDQWKQEMTAEGHSVDTFVADAGDSVQMEALAKATAARFGTIQVMVYATGTNTLDRT